MRNQPMLRDAFWRPSRDVWSDFDRLFETVFAPQTQGFREPDFTPAYDVEETETAYLMSFDVPGVAKEDLKVEITENQLKVSGQRRREVRDEQDGKFRRFERATGQFERVFALPKNVDANRVEASHEDGVLRLVLPKAEAARPRTIQIGTAESKAEGEGFFQKWLNKTKPNGSEAAS